MVTLSSVCDDDGDDDDGFHCSYCSYILFVVFKKSWFMLSERCQCFCHVQISSPLVLLQQRTWLIHWSLFVFFNHPKGRDLIIDMFLYSPQYVLSQYHFSMGI